MNVQKTLSKPALSGQFLIMALGLLISQVAMAAGFEGEATSMMTNIRTGIYAIVGVAATIGLVWQFAQGWMGRKSWGEIFETCGWIVGAGAGIALATWLFTKGGGMSF
ncbi:MAG: TrbC/VirB2 family protein [Neisseria sp.]